MVSLPSEGSTDEMGGWLAGGSTSPNQREPE